MKKDSEAGTLIRKYQAWKLRRARRRRDRITLQFNGRVVALRRFMWSGAGRG